MQRGSKRKDQIKIIINNHALPFLKISARTTVELIVSPFKVIVGVGPFEVIVDPFVSDPLPKHFGVESMLLHVRQITALLVAVGFPKLS